MLRAKATFTMSYCSFSLSNSVQHLSSRRRFTFTRKPCTWYQVPGRRCQRRFIGCHEYGSHVYPRYQYSVLYHVGARRAPSKSRGVATCVYMTVMIPHGERITRSRPKGFALQSLGKRVSLLEAHQTEQVFTSVELNDRAFATTSVDAQHGYVTVVLPQHSLQRTRVVLLPLMQMSKSRRGSRLKIHFN